MNDYTIHCTEAQTKKALELGAQIINYPIQMAPYGVPKYERQLPSGKRIAYVFPTAEQMIGWLEEKNVKCFILPDMYKDDSYNIQINDELVTTGHPQYDYPLTYETRQEATLDAIDNALEYLSNNKNKKEQ